MTLASCSEIDENERLQNVDKPENKDSEVAKKVLIEDFTGQFCVNCPKAVDEIERIQKDYGADTIIAVGIHSGKLGFKGNDKYVGLATDIGDQYYNHWKIEFQPAGLINRQGGIFKHHDWAMAVHNAISQKAHLSIKLENNYNEVDRTVNVTVKTKGIGNSINGKLQLWVIEDNIIAIQKMPNGTNNLKYVHNHVFRTTVNGIWGDDFTIQRDEEKTASYTFKLDDKWVPENVSIVAFVYNGGGVQQVEKKSVK